MNRYQGKLALQQRVLPVYRAPFFDLLASACDGGMSLFTGLPRPNEGVTITNELRNAQYVMGKNIHLFDGSFYLCHQRGLINWLEEWNPDALIVEANPRYLSTPSAVRWMHKRGRPVIGWGLGAPSPQPLSRRERGAGVWVWSSFLRQFDAMICYSQRGAEEYARHGYPLDNLFIAHNAVSPSPTWDLPVRQDAFRDKPCVLFVGRLQFRKNVDLLLGACAEIESQPRLLIVGDGPEREALEELAQEIYPSAEFVGSKHGDELAPYFAEADLFVLPGTGGLAVQEAMSHGLPVIVAQGDGTQDDLVREANGWTIPPGDFDALVSTMKNALSDAARLRSMGAESFRITSEEINIGRMVEVFIAALRMVSP